MKRTNRMKGLMTCVVMTVAAACLIGGPLAAGASQGTQPSGAQASGGRGCLKIGHREGRKHSRICDPLEAAGPPRISISASEYKLVLSRPYIKAGKLRLEYNNRGQDTHNLQLVTLKKGR